MVVSAKDLASVVAPAQASVSINIRTVANGYIVQMNKNLPGVVNGQSNEEQVIEAGTTAAAKLQALLTGVFVA